jgi:hypothetical protein
MKRKEDELFTPNAPESDTYFKVACSMVALLIFFHNPYFHGKTATCGSFLDSDNYRLDPLSCMWISILLNHPTAKLSITLMTILAHQETHPSDLGGVPPFWQNKILSSELIEKFSKGHCACCAKIQPTPEEMKLYFTFYHVLLLRPNTGHISMIPEEGLRHAPTVAIIHHLVWLFESIANEEHDLQCHYAPCPPSLFEGSSPSERRSSSWTMPGGNIPTNTA